LENHASKPAGPSGMFHSRGDVLLTENIFSPKDRDFGRRLDPDPGTAPGQFQHGDRDAERGEHDPLVRACASRKDHHGRVSIPQLTDQLGWLGEHPGWSRGKR
jgi:hypothetical protein